MRKVERIREVSPSEMCSILDLMKNLGLRMLRYGSETKYPTKEHAMRSVEYTSLSGCFLITETLTQIHLTTTYYTNEKQKQMLPTTWVCSLNEKKVVTTRGLSAYMQFQRAAKIPTLKQLGIEHLFHYSPKSATYLESASAYIGSKSHFKAVFSNVYEYDINSAYASVLLKGVPLFSDIDYNRVVGNNEIGFMLDEKLCLCHEGEFAEIICPLVPTPEPLVNYIEKWYQKKLEGDPVAKDMLNFPIGYTQKTNPLFRAYVVNSCNERIKYLMGEHILMWNTDAVFSTEPLKLKIGNNIGEWKVRKINKFTLLDNNYQIEDENPVYRGIPKQWFESFKKIYGRPFDLEKDTVPAKVNKWSMNWKKLTLEESI